MPDSSLSYAIKEAYASAKSDQIIYHTLEVYHPLFTQPLRVVRDEQLLLNARLEDTAPNNPGELVDFLGFQFDITKPDVTSLGTPSCTLVVDNASQAIITEIEKAVVGGVQNQIRVIYREYLSGNVTVGPENDPPLEMTMLSIHANVFRVECQIGFPNLANRRFPSQEYTSDRFPGLVP